MYVNPNRVCSPESHLSNEIGLVKKFQPQAELEVKARTLSKIAKNRNFSKVRAYFAPSAPKEIFDFFFVS